MKTIQTHFSVSKLSKTQLEILNKSALLFDIETTGFSAARTSLYLIGCCYLEGDSFTMQQFFGESKEDEPLLLKAFMELSSRFSCYCSFNALGFDIPYLKQKYEAYQMDASFLSKEHLDFFQILSPYKKLFGLENFKQKTIESWLSTKRSDPFNGGELIQTYRDYKKAPSESALKDMLLHNEEDVKGILSLMELLSYRNFFLGNFQLDSYEFCEFIDYKNQPQTEIRFHLTLPEPVPKKINIRSHGIGLFLQSNTGMLSTALTKGCVKYYYRNYKDYWYFPEEDMAIHKSVAAFASKSSRKKATVDTAYQYISREQMESFDNDALISYCRNQLEHLLL